MDQGPRENVFRDQRLENMKRLAEMGYAPFGGAFERSGRLAEVLAGCAALQPQTPEQIVEQRVEARWNALMKGDFEQAWTFTQPGFRALRRSLLPQRAVRRR